MPCQPERLRVAHGPGQLHLFSCVLLRSKFFNMPCKTDTRRSCASLRPRHTVHPEHKKSGWDNLPWYPWPLLRTCRHPPIASLPLKVQHFLMLSQILLLTKIQSSLPVSSLDDLHYSQLWLKAQVSIYKYV